MLKPLDAQNLLAFLERVSVTGPREAGEYLRCCQLLVTIANETQEPAAEPSRPTLVPTPAAD
jgi:hypothetical protein